jgi:phage-related protein (TIGR01555 family)
MSEDTKFNGLTEVVDSLTQTSPLTNTQTFLFNTPGGAVVTNNRAMLTSFYTSHGIIQIVIDVPVDDAFRGGLDISCPSLIGEDIKKLKRRLQKDRVLETVAQAWKWARLYGGGGIIVNAGQNPTQPFRIEKMKKGQPLSLYAVDRWELAYMPQGQVNNQFDEHLMDIPYNYYGVRLHKSHVIQVKGKEAPSLIRGQFMGWGMSEVERLVSAYSIFLKNRNVTYELLDEAKVDVFAIRGMNSACMTQDGQTKLANHIAAASRLKNYQNALAIDSEDKYEQKQLSFSGLAEIAGQMRIDLASDCRMPLTKLFGLSPSGFSTGDADIENYNSMVETEIRSKCRADIHFILELYCMVLFGFVPEDLEFDFEPLRETSPVDESALKTQELNRIIAAFQNGFITPETAIEQINSYGVFPNAVDPAGAMTLEELNEMRGAMSTVPGGNTDASVVLTP